MFIAFEGVDGTGKSTQLKKCQAWLEELGHHVVVCRDPGSTGLGLRLREILLSKSELKIEFASEMFLFMAARAQMVAEIILPALAQNQVVLCDRFLLSTVVYQGHAGALDVSQIWQIGQTATQGRDPDLTLVFDAPLQVAMKRLAGERDRMESRGEEYFESVRRGFLTEAARLQDTIAVIDASGDPADIHLQVQKAVETKFNIVSGSETP